MGIDFEQLAAVFNQWAQNSVELQEAEWCGVDGKSIKGTVQDYDKGCQNFISLVSVFARVRHIKNQLVVCQDSFEG